MPPRPLRKQHDRFVLSKLAEWLACLSWGKVERRDRDHVLTRHRYRLTAGGNQTHTRRSSYDFGENLSSGAEQVLTVVHHQQQLLLAQVSEHKGQRLGRGLVPQVQGRQEGVGNQGGIPNISELDQPRAARESTCEVCRNPYRKAGLADTPRPDEADQPGRGELLSQFCKLATAADEARRFGRQIARAAGGPGHCEQEVTTAASSSTALDYACNQLFDGFPELPVLPRLTSMAEELPMQRVEVSFVGTPPAQQLERASGVSEVEVDGPILRCLVLGSFQPFLEALRGHEVINLKSVPTEYCKRGET